MGGWMWRWWWGAGGDGAALDAGGGGSAAAQPHTPLPPRTPTPPSPPSPLLLVSGAQENEPDIYHAIKFGTILENVVFDEETRHVDYDVNSITENTRASYPIEHIGACGACACVCVCVCVEGGCSVCFGESLCELERGRESGRGGSERSLSLSAVPMEAASAGFVDPLCAGPC